jgi:hypothetical protein
MKVPFMALAPHEGALHQHGARWRRMKVPFINTAAGS